MAIDVKKYVNPESEETPIVVYQKDYGVLVPLDVNPSTEEQVIEPSGAVNGFNRVNVGKVTSGIDSDIQAGNIRQGVNILGVEGNVVPLDADVLNVTPSVSTQHIVPTSPKNAFSEVNVDAVTAEIDPDIVSGNIKEGVSILGVNGSVVELKGEERDVRLNWYQGNEYVPSSGKNGITKITVRPNNLTTDGNYYVVNPSTIQSYVSIPNGYSGIGRLSVKPVTSEIDADIKAENIKKGVNILGVTGNYSGNNTTLNVNSNGQYRVVGDYTGYDVVEVNVPNATQDVYITRNGTYTPPSPFIGFNSVKVEIDGTILGLNLNEWGGNIVDGVYTRSVKSNLDFSGVVEVANSAFYYGFYYGGVRGEIVFPDLETVNYSGLYYAFGGNEITKLSFPKLKTLGEYALYGVGYNMTNSSFKQFSAPSIETVGYYGMTYCCRYSYYLEDVDLRSLKTVSGYYGLAYGFNNCYRVKNINLSNLETISGYGGMYRCFNNCSALTSFVFEKLSVLTGQAALSQCFGYTGMQTLSFPALKSDSFGSYTDQFNGMLIGCSNVTVHFPSNLQSVIGSWADVVGGFGGTDITVLFDLTATE